MTEQEFPLKEGFIHLNHAAVSPWPRRTVEALKAFAEENGTQGSLGYPRWLKTEEQLREQLRRLIHAPAVEDIALVKNTSEALSFVAYGLDWRAGDSVVITDQEFPSNRVVWESLQDQGVSVRKARLDQHASPEEAIMAETDGSTRLVAVSSVQYASGLRMDLARIGRFCREREVLFCVDAIQSVGALPMDVQAIHADFLAADGHKWMLGPEGLGVFYCRSEIRPRLKLMQYGWHMLEAIGEFDRQEWKAAESARRFECGSPNMLGVHGLHASLSLLLEIGIPAVEESIHRRMNRLVTGLQAIPDIEILSDLRSERRSGILTFRHRRLSDEVIHDVLSRQGVFCARRGGGIRLSPHFYTPLEAINQTLKWITECR
ncbi:aminotransferase class V-fold PLP-dependent enzyme [Thiohalomonas denitrificans]|uniref:aminotransferase class V-fold PLP-dependent enzyme n=1 Tax=Thiohalomonas denitrificans TaxID=415747 RepID=UPI0026ED9612|nr:aminotransferase class V-fold PLP-dependent enzyme [Thiohalomonas denitrificans]